MLVAALILGLLGALLLGAALVVLLYPWRVSASLRALGSKEAMSVAGGAEVARSSLSLGARWGGPVVLNVAVLGRSVVRRATTTEALMASFSAREKAPAGPPGAGARVGRWLVARTDLGALPGLGRRLLGRLLGPSFHGSVICGFADAALTGRAAALLATASGVLGPLGVLEAEIDWSGRTVLDLTVDLSFRMRIAPLGYEALRFAFHHVHFLAGPGPREASAAA